MRRSNVAASPRSPTRSAAPPAPRPDEARPLMPGAADIVVVGAGCVGSSVAYRLAQRGARVTVVDAGAPGGGTSGASFAWTNSFGKTPRDYHDLNVASMEEHAALAKELGGSWLHQDGGLAWEETPRGASGSSRRWSGSRAGAIPSSGS